MTLLKVLVLGLLRQFKREDLLKMLNRMAVSSNTLEVRSLAPEELGLGLLERKFAVDGM